MTYAELVQLVQDYLEDDETTFVGDLDDMIQQAESRILYLVPGLPAYFLASTGNLAIGNRFLAVPADFMSTQSISVSDGTSYSNLIMKESSFVREAYPTGASGVPRFYTFYDSVQLMLAPTPDQAYAYELFYYGIPESIVTATSSWLGTYAEDALLYGTLVEAYTFLKGDADIWQGYKLRYDESIARLKNYADGLATRDTFRDPEVRVMPT